MKYFQAVLLVAFVATGHVGFCQGQDNAKTTRLQNTRYYEREIPTYKKVLENGQYPAVMEKLADCYRTSGDIAPRERGIRKTIQDTTAPSGDPARGALPT